MNLSGPLGIESAFGLLCVAALAALQARAFRGAQRHQIQEICSHRGRPERCGEIVEVSETIAFIAASVVVMAAVIATLVASQWLVAATADSLALKVSGVAGWIVLSWVMLVVVPMLFTKFIGAWFVVATWNLWRPIVALTSPVVRLLAAMATGLARLVGRRGVTVEDAVRQDELLAVVDEAHREGWLPGTTRAMIEGVMDLHEVRVGQIMTPRTDIISIPLATPWDEAIRLVSESAHTRLPVWGRSPEDVVGILHTRELLARLVETPANGHRVSLHLLCQPPGAIAFISVCPSPPAFVAPSDIILIRLLSAWWILSVRGNCLAGVG